jgi:hypothetical protein
VIHAVGPSLQRSRQNRSEMCRLFPAKIPGRGSVVETTRRLCPVNAWPPFDDIEVELQNAPFAKDKFGHRYQCGLRTLAQDRAARSEEQVLYQLLCKGGASAKAAASHIVFSSKLNRMPVETMVLVEARILCGDDSVLEIRRYLTEGYEFVSFVIRHGLIPALHSALHLHRGCRWVDPPEDHKNQCGQQPKKRRTEAKPSSIEAERPLSTCGL